MTIGGIGAIGNLGNIGNIGGVGGAGAGEAGQGAQNGANAFSQLLSDLTQSSQQADGALTGLATGTPASPTFKEALETQYVCDAVLKSAKTQRWEKVAK